MALGLSALYTNAQDGFKTSQTGLQYKLHRVNEQAPKANLGDILYMDMLYVINGETVFYDSRANNMPVQLELMPSSYPGDLNEALAMLHVGDSASFIIDAADFFLKTVQSQQMPEPFKQGDKLHFHIVLNQVQSREAYIQEQQKMYAEREEQKVKAREKEKGDIARFITDRKLDAQELAGGLRIVHTLPGQGTQAVAGKMVSVHYKGYLLDGTVFDASYDRGQPISFKLGGNQVIQGWEKGIAELKEGGKAMLIIPFDMGYGDRPSGSIPPMSTLIFEVELMDVVE